ncbi:hypothetical protein D3C73_1097600 [compost metagenome]
MPDDRTDAVPPFRTQPPQPVAGQTGLHPQAAPGTLRPGQPAPGTQRPGRTGVQPRPQSTVCRRQPGQPAVGADLARRHGRQGAGRRKWLRRDQGRAERNLRPGVDGRTDARHGWTPEHRSDSPMGKRTALHATAHRRPHRPRHGQREARLAAKRHGRLPDQTHQ